MVRRAVVIGINEYLDPLIPQLSYSVNDAKAVAEILAKSGYDVFHLHDLAQREYRPSRKNIINTLKKLQEESKDDDLLLFYFSGQAYMTEEKSPLLIPRDAYRIEKGNAGIEIVGAIPIRDIVILMNTCLARSKVLILDAFLAGANLDELAEAISTSNSNKRSSVKARDHQRYAGYALFYEAEGSAMLAATTGSQVSRESVAFKHGYFTYHLLKGLEGAALHNNKPFITFTDIALYTTQQLRNMSWGEGFQEPTALMAMKGDMILVENQDFKPDYRPIIVPRRMVFRYNTRFVVREEQLETLKQTLLEGKGVKGIAITGMGGVGKTQIAGKFVYEHERDFPGGVFWLDFANSEQVLSEIADCGSRLYMNLKGFEQAETIQEKADLVKKKWNEPNEPRCLLIFDKCEDEQLFLEHRPQTGNCSFIITSRRRGWEEHGLEEIHLGPLNEEDAVALLCNFREFAPEDYNALKEICRKLGYLPLALHLAGSVLTSNISMKSSTYLQELAKSEASTQDS